MGSPNGEVGKWGSKDGPHLWDHLGGGKGMSGGEG